MIYSLVYSKCSLCYILYSLAIIKLFVLLPPDDMIFVFQRMEDAERFYRVLPKRLRKYGLTLHEEKSQLLPSGHTVAMRAEKDRKLTAAMRNF